VCYDLLHQQVRGPLMVVVPGGEDHSSFAIGKYEISNEDWNKYCFLSGKCAVDEDAPKEEPRTGLSLEQIRGYTEWLSGRTGKTYRLPTAEEWEYAARAQGQQPPKDFNCRVVMNGKVLKGGSLNQVSVGHQNGWGLQNYVGNAQELVVSGEQVIARGGAYLDRHSECGIDFRRSREQAETATGFRILREEVRSSAVAQGGQ
jgi:formylglycine-generating enzyme required for sulfatase activity